METSPNQKNFLNCTIQELLWFAFFLKSRSTKILLKRKNGGDLVSWSATYMFISNHSSFIWILTACLPTTYVMWREAMFSQVCVCSSPWGSPSPSHSPMSLPGGWGPTTVTIIEKITVLVLGIISTEHHFTPMGVCDSWDQVNPRPVKDIYVLIIHSSSDN